MLKEGSASTVDAAGEALSVRLLKGRLDAFKYKTSAELAADCRRIASVCSDEARAVASIAAILDAADVGADDEANGEDGAAAAKESKEKDTPDRRGGKRASAAAAAAAQSEAYEDPDGAEMHSELEKSGAKRSRVSTKNNQYENFLKQQRLHPELAGVYAEQYMTSTEQVGLLYQQLRVYRDAATVSALVGTVQIEPHTTFRDLRVVLQTELGFDCENSEELVLGRTAGQDAPPSAAAAGGPPAESWRRLVCPIPLTQNHKLVHPLFTRPDDVLIVSNGGRQLSDETLADIHRRALPGTYPPPTASHVRVPVPPPTASHVRVPVRPFDSYRATHVPTATHGAHGACPQARTC